MVGMAMIWMPAQTNGLNQLPPELYPHGTAVMNTLQQVVGAIGTAVAISILTVGMDKYLHGSSAPTNLGEIANAMQPKRVLVRDDHRMISLVMGSLSAAP